MQENQIEREKDRVERQMIDKLNAGELVATDTATDSSGDKRVRFSASDDVGATPARGPRRRLDIQSVSAAAEVCKHL